MFQVPLPSVRCIRFGSVFLFPQLSCFNTTVHTHFGVFIIEIRSGEFDSSKNWVFPKTPLPWGITEGHGCWVHSCWSHWREQTLFTAFVCVCVCVGGGVRFTDFIDFSGLRCLKIQHTSVSSVPNRGGRKQFPESQIWLLCCRDLVGGLRWVNAALFVHYLRLNVGETF